MIQQLLPQQHSYGTSRKSWALLRVSSCSSGFFALACAPGWGECEALDFVNLLETSKCYGCCAAPASHKLAGMFPQ